MTSYEIAQRITEAVETATSTAIDQVAEELAELLDTGAIEAAREGVDSAVGRLDAIKSDLFDACDDLDRAVAELSTLP